MEKEAELDVAEMKEDIKEMRRVMDAGTPAFRYIYQARHMRLLFLIGGCWILAFALAYHGLLMIYGSYGVIPQKVKLVYFGLLILSWLGVFGMRVVLTWKAGLKLDKDLTMWKLAKMTLSSRFWLAGIPVVVVFLILPFKMQDYWLGHCFVLSLAIGFGLFLNMFGVAISVAEYSAAGGWLVVSGLIGLFFVEMPIHVALVVTFVPASFIFALMAYLGGKRHQYDEI